MKNLKDLTPEECILIAKILVPDVNWKLILSKNKWDGFDLIDESKTEETSEVILQIDYRDVSLLNRKDRFRFYHNLNEIKLHQVNINYALEFIKKLTNSKKLNRKDLENAILFFAKLYEKEDNYKALMETYKSLPKLVELIVYEMFLNKFNSYYCSDEEYKNYGLIYEYSSELSKNGFVSFDSK